MEDTANEFDEEKVKGDLSSTIMDVEISGHAPKLRNARKGKLAHLTKRKNIMLELMEDALCVQEVKENLNKFVSLLDDFKSLHETYQELLSEEEARQDEVEWFKPKMADINTFVSSVSEWLSGVSKAVEPQEIEVAPKDSISQISSHESKSRVFSVASASLQVEAERAAVLAKVAALREKHDLEDREEALNKERQALKKKREVLELKAQLDASSAKLAVLKSAGKYYGASAATGLTSNPYDVNVPRESYLAEMSSKSYASECEFLSLDKVAKALSVVQTPSVRPKDIQPSPSPQRSNGHNAIRKKAKEVQPPGPGNLHAQSNLATGSASDQSSDQSSESVASSGVHLSSLVNILQRQNDITSLLVKQHQLSSLPQREIPIFDGDILKYRPFIRAFEYGIELKTDSSADRLYFLDQYTSGFPRDLVRSCLHMTPDKGYERARDLLQKNFGDEFSMCSAYMKKALEWPTIRPEDSKSLQAFAIFLRSCCNAMADMSYSHEINLSSNMKVLVSKLPYKLRERWRSKVWEFQETQNSRPQFKDLVLFVEKQVRLVSDPIFGDIQDKPLKSNRSLVEVPLQLMFLLLLSILLSNPLTTICKSYVICVAAAITRWSSASYSRKRSTGKR